MIAPYKIKSHIFSSLKTEHQSHSLCSTTFTSNSVLIPILMCSGTSDLVSILISFMFKYGLRLSIDLFLAW